MLQSIRDKTHGWIAGVIISLLILSFAMWGIHSYFLGTGDNSVIAKVNGTEITKNQLGAAYERLHRQLQIQSGNNPLPPNAELNLKNRALQTLIQLQVFEQASIADNYRISPGQIDGFLQGMPEFQVKGEFSPLRFQQALNAMLFTPPDFISLVRATLLMDQPRLGIVFSSIAMPDEITGTMALISQERNIRYLIIPQDYFKQNLPVISNDQIQAWYNAHQNEFKTEEQVSIEYILLSVKDLAKKMNPTEEELKRFYMESSGSSAQSSGWKPDKKLRENYIQQKAEEAFAEKREKAANLAYEHPDSLKSAAEQLGLTIQTTGLFTKDKPGTDLTSNIKVREAAFANDVLSLQNNSDVIQIDPDSAVILRIKSHVPSAVLPLTAVRSQIEEKLKIAAMEQKLSVFANEITTKLATGQSTPDQIASENHLQWIEAGYLGRHADKVDQAILNTAFRMPSGNNKPVYANTKMAKGFAVIGLIGVKPGNTNVSAEQYQAFADQIQGSFGTLEYELYKVSLMNKAKVVIEN